MSGSTCTCGEPATRLVRVVPRTMTGKRAIDDQSGRGIAAAITRTSDDSRTTTWASCEMHRQAVQDVLAAQWAVEMSERHVAVRLGKRRRAGL